MSLVDYLYENRTALELAKLLVAEAKENARLRDELHRAKYKLFWIETQLINQKRQ